MKQRFRNKRRRAERQAEAIGRQARYDALSIEDKITTAALRPGYSFREMRRLDPEALALPVGGVRLA